MIYVYGEFAISIKETILQPDNYKSGCRLMIQQIKMRGQNPNAYDPPASKTGCTRESLPIKSALFSKVVNPWEITSSITIY